MDLRNLDDVTRAAMLGEVDHDIAAGPGPTGVLYLSPRLSPQGVSDYPDLLRDAVQTGNDATLAAALASNGRLLTHETAKHPKGGPDIVKAVPVTAPQTMAEGEFNRYYARGVCVRALAETGPQATMTIYRARESTNPRSASVALVGTTPSAAALLEDLRPTSAWTLRCTFPRARTPVSASTSEPSPGEPPTSSARRVHAPMILNGGVLSRRTA